MVFYNNFSIFRFKNFPNVNTLKQQSVVFFANTDPLLEPSRALPPNVIPVGGLHIDHPKPLFAVSRVHDSLSNKTSTAMEHYHCCGQRRIDYCFFWNTSRQQ